ncbi:MAG: hypothetical protein LBL58_10640 [Tannerellaceae bacterium]|jgi:hypothetical protein|nr:hypothetical protein [Tannerellaceae bacterium]
MKKKIEICILGNGPTARICSFLIKTPHILIGNQNNFGSLTKTKIAYNNINLIPIFPVYNSHLYNKLWENNFEKHDFLNYSERGDISIEFDSIQEFIKNASSLSYAVQRLKEKQDFSTKKNIILAYKLFGRVIFERELNRLLAKVNKHYNGMGTNKRIGYINKLSPYHERIANICFDNFFSDEIKKIDIKRKIIYTKTSDITYSKLISTIDLRDFFHKINYPNNLNLVSSSAYFCLIKINAILPINLVIYDVEIKSPIYRIFTISENFIIIQLAFNCQNIDSHLLFQALYKLLGRVFDILFEYRYMMKNAYPICTSSDILLQQYKHELASNDIHLIGRYAEWEYLDLHELNYAKLYL